MEKDSILNALAASSWGLRESCTENGNCINNKSRDTGRNIFRSVSFHHRHSWKGVEKNRIIPRKYKNHS